MILVQEDDVNFWLSQTRLGTKWSRTRGFGWQFGGSLYAICLMQTTKENKGEQTSKNKKKQRKKKKRKKYWDNKLNLTHSFDLTKKRFCSIEWSGYLRYPIHSSIVAKLFMIFACNCIESLYEPHPLSCIKCWLYSLLSLF